MRVDVQSPNAKTTGLIDATRVDATTEADIADHQTEYDSNAPIDSAKFARRVAGGEALDWFTSMQSLTEAVGDDNLPLVKIVQPSKTQSASSSANKQGT